MGQRKFLDNLRDTEIVDLKTQFLSLCETVRSLLLQAGISSFPSTREKTLERLYGIENSRLEALNRQLKICIHIYSEAVEASGDDYDERRALRKALNFYGNTLDAESFSTVGPDDIIEIYDSESNQLYRSINFFKTTGYSLEDLLLNEWYYLWERPTWVFESLMKTMTSLLEGKMERAAFNVPEHLIREIYQNEQNPDGARLLLTNMKMCLPYRDGSKAIKGIVCTSQCKQLANVEQSQAPGISFL